MRRPLKTYSVRGYEIPAASPSVLLYLALALLLPLAWIGAGWWFTRHHRLIYYGLAWILVWIAFFHVRNIAVRKEVDQGLHDPLYGPHLMRMRQREFEQSKSRKWLIGVQTCAAIGAVVVGALQANGINVLPRWHSDSWSTTVVPPLAPHVK
ncbi:hypothetical protein [Burkholderia vietnamiensis]|uniref:hypothetical protein n=1 Tax=Burkholderia vietnamiensis TaxID=60552 RepID=UPI001CF11C43|nr:hypothetical protein [Burkholderia vietnamiensis]MCA8228304.1 hypothetical protein [Burkholderia vietnamiensis]